MPTNETIVLSVPEAAVISRTSKSTIYEWMKRADCDFAFKIGGKRIIIKSKFEAWLNRQAEAYYQAKRQSEESYT